MSDIRQQLQSLLAQLDAQQPAPAPSSPAVPMVPSSEPISNRPAPSVPIDYSQLGAAIAQHMPQQSAPAAPSQYPISDRGAAPYRGPSVNHWSAELANDPYRLSKASWHQMRIELGDHEARRRHLEAVARVADNIRINPKAK